MTSAAEPLGERADVRTIVVGGVILGLLTAVGVVAFALLSRAVHGTTLTVVQSLLVLVGGVIATYFPALRIHPRSADGVAWASLVGLLGALTFTVVDTAVLRPVGIYSWTWDRIGGGSGFWYIPVWWMGAAVLAWLGAWALSLTAAGAQGVEAVRRAGMTIVVAAVVFAVLVVSRAAPATTAIVALAYAVAVVLGVPLAAVARRR
jgi:hypothetical protein